MIITPNQEILARNCAQRALLAGMKTTRPEYVTIPLIELDCLCIAAAATLDLRPEAFDTGAFTAPETLNA